MKKTMLLAAMLAITVLMMAAAPAMAHDRLDRIENRVENRLDLFDDVDDLFDDSDDDFLLVGNDVFFFDNVGCEGPVCLID
jgi:hypothetical protein